MGKTAKQIIGFLIVLMAAPFLARGEQPQRGIPGTYELNGKGADPTLVPSVCVGKDVYLRREPTIYRSTSEIMQVRRTENGAVETKSLPEAIKAGWVLCRSRKDAQVGVVVEVLSNGKFELVIPDVEDAAIFSGSDTERHELEPLAKMRLTTSAKGWPAQAVIDAFGDGWQDKQWEAMRAAMEKRASASLGDKLQISPENGQIRLEEGRVLLPAIPSVAQLQIAEALAKTTDPEIAAAIVNSSRHWKTINRAQIEAAIAILNAKPISSEDAATKPDVVAQRTVALGTDPNTGSQRRILLLDGRAGTPESLRKAIDTVRSIENAPTVVITRGLPGEKDRLAGIVGDTGPTQILLHRPSLEAGLDPVLKEKGLIDAVTKLTGAKILGAEEKPRLFVPRTRVVVIDREFLPVLEQSIKNGEFKDSHIWAIVCPIEDADLDRISNLAVDPAVGKALSFSVTTGRKQDQFPTVSALAIVAHLAQVGFTPWGGESRLDCIRRFYQSLDQKIDSLQKAINIALPVPLKNDQNDADQAAKKSVIVVLETHLISISLV